IVYLKPTRRVERKNHKQKDSLTPKGCKDDRRITNKRFPNPEGVAYTSSKLRISHCHFKELKPLLSGPQPDSELVTKSRFLLSLSKGYHKGFSLRTSTGLTNFLVSLKLRTPTGLTGHPLLLNR